MYDTLIGITTDITRVRPGKKVSEVQAGCETGS